MGKRQGNESRPIKEPIDVEHEYEYVQIDKQTFRRNKFIRFLLLGAAVSLTTFTVLGTAGLAFFFVTQFGLMYALPTLVTLIGSAIVSSIIFAAYFSIFTVGLWNRTIEICDVTFPVKDHYKKKALREISEDEVEELPAHESTNNDPDTKKPIKKSKAAKKKDKTTALQRVSQFVVGVTGILAILFLAAGAYLGVFSVGEATGLLNVFVPLAIMSAVCMFASMTYYFWPDMMTNAKKMATLHKPKTKPKSNHKHDFSPKANLVIWGYRLMAIGASVGFAAFKLYSTIHVVKLFGVTSPMTITVIGAVAFVSMLIMTAITSGVRIWKIGNQYACKLDGIKYKSLTAQKNTKEQKNLIPYGIAAVITFLAAVFNGAASYMGMSTLSDFFVSLMPAYGAFVGPIFIAVGVFVTITRIVDFWEYYGPAIAYNLKGIKYTPMTEEIKLDSDGTYRYKNDPLAVFYKVDPSLLRMDATTYKNDDSISGTYSDPTRAERKSRGNLTLAQALASQELDHRRPSTVTIAV